MATDATLHPAEVLERAHKMSVRTEPVDQARFVQDTLGSRLAAAALGLKDTRTLSSWAAGKPIRSADGAHRLQVLYRAVFAIVESFGPAVAAAFLRGSNPTLDDRAPLVVLAENAPQDTEIMVMDAVEALLTA